MVKTRIALLSLCLLAAACGIAAEDAAADKFAGAVAAEPEGKVRCAGALRRRSVRAPRALAARPPRCGDAAPADRGVHTGTTQVYFFEPFRADWKKNWVSSADGELLPVGLLRVNSRAAVRPLHSARARAHHGHGRTRGTSSEELWLSGSWPLTSAVVHPQRASTASGSGRPTTPTSRATMASRCRAPVSWLHLDHFLALPLCGASACLVATHPCPLSACSDTRWRDSGQWSAF